ncbi:hypothetical protein P9112_002623 [Eukaryota sp. TZLM1-RC]
MTPSLLEQNDFDLFATILCDICRRLHVSATVVPLSLCYFADILAAGWIPDDIITHEVMVAACILLACKHVEEGHGVRHIAIALCTILVPDSSTANPSELALGNVEVNSSQTYYDLVRDRVGQAELHLLRHIGFFLDRDLPLFNLENLDIPLEELSSLYTVLLSCLSSHRAHFLIRETDFDRVLRVARAVTFQIQNPEQQITISPNDEDLACTILDVLTLKMS